MKIPYVHSNFARVEGDYYPTIDDRCIKGFLQHFQPIGLCVDPCAPDESGIVNTLLELGYHASGLPDAFEKNIIAQWIICNPPYARGLVDEIINRQIERIYAGEVEGVAMLLRSNFDFAKSRRAMFADPTYFGQIKLLFRPWWSEDRTAQPIHNYVWQIWKSNNTQRYPAVMYAG